MRDVILNAGDTAPAFTLVADDGTEVALAALRQKIVLYFYPKDDTSGCTAEAIDFNRLHADFGKAGTAVFGVSPDSTQSHVKFKTKHKLVLPLLSDEGKAMLEAYGVWQEKSMYGRKYMGVERTTILIDAAGQIVRVWNKVKVPGHAQEVLDAAKAA